MQEIWIHDGLGAIEAMILPEYGGMCALLRLHGRDVFRLHRAMLGVRNVASGGSPVLFPFASRTSGDMAVFDGRAYDMPMHGFAMNMPFALSGHGDDWCEVTLTATDETMRKNYPYDFQLHIRYEVDDAGLHTTTTVQNRSSSPMPYAIGYHPYFLAAEPKKIDFACNLRDYDDYLNGGARGHADGAIEVWRPWDHVFFGGEPMRAELVNHHERYRAVVWGGPAYTVMTLCTTQPEAVCVEPWQGMPNAANNGGARLIAPGASETCTYTITLSDP